MRTRLSDDVITDLIDLIKGRKDPLLIAKAIQHSSHPYDDDGTIHALFERHDHLNYHDFVYLSQMLTPKAYLTTLIELNKSGRNWLKPGIDGDYENRQAIANIQGFLERAESFKGDESTAKIDTGAALDDGHLLLLMATLDRPAKDLAERFRTIEFSLLSSGSRYYRHSYVESIIENGRNIEQGAGSSDVRVKTFLHQLDIFKRMTGTTMPDYKTLKVILMSSGDPEANNQPDVKEGIRSLGASFVDRIAILTPEERKDWFQSLLPDSIQSIKFVMAQAQSLSLSEARLSRLYRSAFLTITNGNRRCRGKGVNELVELMKPNLNWPAMIKMLDDTGRKVLIDHVTDRDSYLKLMPREFRGKALEDDLGL